MDPIAQVLLMTRMPPPEVDPLWSKVLFLSPWEGANNQKGITDLSDNRWLMNAEGAGVLSTTQTRYGNAANFAGGTFGGFTCPTPSTVWCLSNANSDEFLIEFSTYIISLHTADVITVVGTGGTSFWLRIQGDLVRFLGTKTGSGFTVDFSTPASTIVANTWQENAVEKNSSGVMRIYVGGVMKAKTTPADSILFNHASLKFEVNAGGGQNIFVANTRVTKGPGAARYDNDAGYTPRVTKYPFTSNGWITAGEDRLSNNAAGWNGITIRQVYKAGLLFVSGSEVRFLLQAGAAGCSVGHMRVGIGAMAGNEYSFATPPIDVTVGGSQSFTIGANASVMTDVAVVPLSDTLNFVMAFYFNAASDVLTGNSTAPLQAYYKSGDDTATMTASGYTTGSSAYFVRRVEVPG